MSLKIHHVAKMKSRKKGQRSRTAFDRFRHTTRTPCGPQVPKEHLGRVQAKSIIVFGSKHKWRKQAALSGYTWETAEEKMDLVLEYLKQREEKLNELRAKNHKKDSTSADDASKDGSEIRPGESGTSSISTGGDE